MQQLKVELTENKLTIVGNSRASVDAYLGPTTSKEDALNILDGARKKIEAMK